ncbi:MAG: hypothetical protein U9M90_00715 [Patescibacteria group bacterium]|nr:hypothetical protein [Patescibacteria group bacterium]
MNISDAIVRAGLRNGCLFIVINKLITKMAVKKKETKYKSEVNLEQVLEENDLTFTEAGSFRNKAAVIRVKDTGGNSLILKTGGIEPFQVQLLKTAKLIESQLCFKVPTIIKQGEDWILLEDIQGQSLNELIDRKPQWCAEVSKKITDDYQKVTAKILETENPGNLFEDGKRWIFSRLLLWGGSIINAGLMEYQEIKDIADEFERIIKQKGEDLFGWFHGNIIGDHVIVSGDDIYLLDLHIVPRAGKNYYDFLRALDFMFLKSSKEEEMFNLIPQWVQKYLPQEDHEEVKLVLASRFIGILGWDILFHKVEYTEGSLEKKKELAMKFIKKEY